MRKIFTLSYHDLLNIMREPMLMLFMICPCLLAIALRWIIPYSTEILSIYVDLRTYYPLYAGCIMLFIPMLMGLLTGFILLDERDDHVMMTLIVTPLGKRGYLAYRIIIPTLVSVIYSVAIQPIIDLGAYSLMVIIPVALLAALQAPIVALFLVTFAGNKVEGLALSKALGMLLLAPIGGYFIHSNLRYVLGIFPTFWAPLALAVGDVTSLQYWIYIGGGVLISMGMLVWFVRRFERYIA